MSYADGSSTAYAYDTAGNRARMGGSFARTGLPTALSSAVYDGANRLRQWGATSLNYDANGNMTSHGTNTYNWDARDRLASITGASFQYDPFGRRTRKTIGGVTTSFLYDGVNPVQEIGPSTANLLTGLGVDEFFTRTDTAGMRAMLADALGSVLGLTDSGGLVQTQYTYEPFGKPGATGQASGNPFQYTGRENDGTPIYYDRARYFHPTLQRFISEDPVRFRGGDFNLYAYVADSPLSYTDPFGLDKEPVWARFLPDFYSAQLNVAIPTPYTATLVDISVQLTVDRYGNFYLAPGVVAGRAPLLVSPFATAGYVNQTCMPAEQKLRNVLSGHSFGLGAGFATGAGLTWSPSNGTATQLGLYAPQLGVGYSYGIRLGNPFRALGINLR